MGSLYEPSIRSSTWELPSRGFSKRFTTLEGWREIGAGVYAMGNSNIRMFSIRNQFDPEHINVDQEQEFDFTPAEMLPSVKSKASVVEYRRSSEGTIGKAIGSIRDTKAGVLRTSSDEVYNVYTRKEKWIMVAIVGVAGIFPALTFNIYLPALARMSTDLQVSSEAIHLTITTYLIVQGITPIISGPLADTLGRRSAYIYSFLLYAAASIVLSFSPNFAVLLIFRGLQAAGIASTVSTGCAVIQDITPASERDSFYKFYQGIRNVALILAPMIGGLTSNWANFRCLFVIVFAFSLTTLVAIAFFLPETLRSIAGNGALPLIGIHQPLIWRCRFFGKSAHVDENLGPRGRPKPEGRKFSETFHLLRESDIILSLAFSGVIFAIWMVVTVSTTTLFMTRFGLKESLLGLAFIPNALGTITGSTLIGNLLTQDFLTACSVYQKIHSLPPTAVISRHSLPADFPLEHARLIRLPGLTVIFTIALSLYGFTLSYPSLTSLGGWVAIPLLLQFLIAAMAHAICGVHQTLISDLWPWSGAAAATVSNLVKCLLAGVGVAVIDKMLGGIGVGPTFLALGLVVMVLIPLPIVQYYWGGGWREVRSAKFSLPTGPYQTDKV